jgi:hypothetical protein
LISNEASFASLVAPVEFRKNPMATDTDFRRIALALEGTTSAPHFDRTAFKVARTYATLAPDGLTANLKFMPDEQELKCLTAPEAFQPLPNAWGKRGWTVANLAMLDVAELQRALETAWHHGLPKKSPTRNRKSGR